MDFFELLGEAAEALGAGEALKRATGGAGAYARGQSTQTRNTEGDENQPYGYERWLTRPRDPSVNDR
jgi:hypothetical protein